MLEDETSQVSILKATESQCLAESQVQNPLGGVVAGASPLHPMPAFPLFEECRSENKERTETEELTTREATESRRSTCWRRTSWGPFTSTVFVVSLVIFLGVIAVGLISFLPIYSIGFRAVDGTAELIQTEALKSITTNMRSTVVQLRDFAYCITANYMVNKTSPYSRDAFPDNSLSLLHSLLSVLSSFQDTVAVVKFYYEKGLYALASEVLWGTNSTPDYLLGSHSGQRGISTVDKYDRATLNLIGEKLGITWNISNDLVGENGTFKKIVEPWNKHGSLQRWNPDAMHRTGLYFNYIIPFRINGHLGNCEVVMPTQHLLREIKPLIVALRKHGRVMLFDDKRDIVMLNSWDQTTTTWTGNRSHPLSFSHLRLEDINDPLAAEVGRQAKLHKKKLDDLVNSTVELTFPFEGSSVRASFARITDRKGLNIMLCVAVLRSDFFSTIVRARAIVLVIVIVVVVWSAIIAFIGSFYLVKPLTHLVKALKKVSNLDLPVDDDGAINPSRILEVEEIQSDYVKLLHQLYVLRNFVPEPILARENFSHTGGTGVSETGNIGDETTRLFFEETGSGERMVDGNTLRRDVRLNSGILMEQLNVFSPKHSTVVAVEMHEPGFWEDPNQYMSHLIATATIYSGCVETLGLEKAVVSFGAHTTIPMHSNKGCHFAYDFFSKLTDREQAFVTIVLESNEFLVGACGANLRNARVLFGTQYLFELTKAMIGASYHIAVTSGVASQLNTHRVFPVDCVLISSTNAPIVLHELRLQDAQREQLIHISRHFRLGFAAMRQGDYKQAMSHYHRIGKSDPQARRLLRLCEQRCRSEDVAPYVRCGSHTYDIHGNFIGDSCLGPPPSEDSEKKSVSKANLATSSANHKHTESFSNNVEEEALFEMYHSSSSSDSIQAGGEGYGSADTMPVFLTDLNNKVWTRSLKKISEGAFSIVFFGMSEEGVQAAIKCIPRRRRDIMQESLEAEINFASKLRHPNIVQYVSCSVIQSHLAIIMEYVPGGSLHAVIKNFGRVSPSVARRFTVDILNGLSYLHRLGIVHCDVKPHNVLLGMDGVCKLSDFGSTISEATDMARTMADEVTLRGTALYMAPEVACGGRCTPQSDIFSLGISLLEMLIGRLPWRWSAQAPEGSDAASLHALFHRDTLFVRSLARGHVEPDIPDSLDNEVACFVQSCCHLDPSMRPSALDLLSYAFVL